MGATVANTIEKEIFVSHCANLHRRVKHDGLDRLPGSGTES